LDGLDINVVLGLFTYPNGAPDGTDEIDIEFSQWGNPQTPGLGWTVYPNHHSNLKDRNLQVKVSSQALTTVRFTWTAGSIVYEYFAGHQDINDHSNPLQNWSVTGAVVASDPQLLLMNLWIFEKHNPSAEIETVITNFEYKKL